MAIKIEFNTSEILHGEAEALVALLSTLYPGVSSEPAKVNVTVNNHAQTALETIEAMRPEPTEELTEEDEAPSGEFDPEATDANGVKWDARIHSSNKKQIADGTWQKRRGVHPTVYEKVMAELKGAAPTPAEEATAEEAFTPPASVVIAPHVEPAPPAPPAPTPAPPAPTPAPPAQGDISFVDMMKRVTSLQAEGKLPKETLDAHIKSIGLESISQLATNADARAALVTLLAGL